MSGAGLVPVPFLGFTPFLPLYIYGRGNFVGFEGDNKRARSSPRRASGLETTGTSVSEKHVSAIAPKVQWRISPGTGKTA